MEPDSLKLPLSLQSRADINRLIRELASLDGFFLSSGIRQSAAEPPQLTRLLHELADINQKNLLEQAKRAALKSQLEALVGRAPHLHLSFASEPQPKIVEQILSWLRANINPECLIIVGLQPDIAGGIVLRTPNKIFDLSLKKYLANQEPYLIKLIDEVARG